MKHRRTHKKRRVTSRLPKSRPALRRFANKVSMVVAEKKYISTVVASSISNTPGIQPLTFPGQGTTDQTRVGDQIRLRSLEVDYSWSISGTVTPDSYNRVRLIVFQWYPQIGFPVAADILLLPTNQPWQSPLSHDQRFQYRVLYDKTHVISAQNQFSMQRKVMITRIPHRKMQFVGGNATDADNRIGFLVVSDSGLVDHPSFEAIFKLNFSDM